MALASTNIENDPEDAQSGSPAAGGAMQKRGALSEMGSGGAGDLPGQLTKQVKGLEEARSKKKTVIDDAIKNLSTREAPSGPSASDLFRLMGAFAAPTRTGGFSETLGKVGEVGADILDKRQAAAASLQDLKMKYQLQGLDIDSEHLKDVTDATKTLQAANAPASVYGKTAQDEGHKPGTPAFAARVQELAAADLQNKTAKAQGNTTQAGKFDPKSGNYIAPNGTVIKASEIKEDRSGRDAIVKLQDQLKLLDPKTIKNADSFFDMTGAGHFGDLAKTVGGKFAPETAKAQLKINSAALNDRLKNLPPGPASDKDIAQAKSTFPGFSNAKNLQDWTDRTNQAIDNYLQRQNDKYGDVQWYGAGAAPGAPSAPAAPPGAGPGAAPGAPSPATGPGTSPPPSGGPTPDDKGRYKAQSAPKVGAVYKGYRYLGGDPSKKESYEKV